MIAAKHSQQEQGRLLTYLRLHIDGIVTQSTAALSVSIDKHPPTTHHFYGRDLILIG